MGFYTARWILYTTSGLFTSVKAIFKTQHLHGLTSLPQGLWTVSVYYIRSKKKSTANDITHGRLYAAKLWARRKLNVWCVSRLSKRRVKWELSQLRISEPSHLAAMPACHDIKLTIGPFWSPHPGAVADVSMNRLRVKYPGCLLLDCFSGLPVGRRRGFIGFCFI